MNHLSAVIWCVALGLCTACQVVAGFDEADLGPVHVPAEMLSLFSRCAPPMSDVMVEIDTDRLHVDGVGLPSCFQDSGQEPVGNEPVGNETSWNHRPQIAVLLVGRFDVESFVTVNVVGTRPLVIVATEEVTIAGIVDASARNGRPCPDGDPLGAGKEGQHANDERNSGGGGAGHRRPGGVGGKACDADMCKGGRQGEPVGNDVMSILRGGSIGGSGGAADPNKAASGGCGGGAVQIFSRHSIEITSSGRINAGGAGGAGGGDGAGGGGGSGGAIVLQAPRINHMGALVANGGGGGSGSRVGEPGKAGENGSLDNATAKGGDFGVNDGEGGNGGSLDDGAKPGGKAADGSQNGGGGGGAEGRIVIITKAADDFVNKDESVVSPTAHETDYSRLP